MNNFNAYIDESGDKGFTWYDDGTGSSHWFVLSAIVVAEEQDREVSHVIDDIKERLNLPTDRPLHWVKRRRHSQRKYIAEEISERNFSLISVAVDKFEIDENSKLREHPSLYLYTSRMLMERLSWFVDDRNGLVDCVFEHRKNLSHRELRAYIESQIVDPGNEIRPRVVDDIKAEEAWQFKNLQIADVCAGALFNAFEINQCGHVEPAYLLQLREQFYERHDKLMGYGLKVFPHKLQAIRSMEELDWIDDLRT